MEKKICSACKKEHDINAYLKRSGRIGQFTSHCFLCRKKRNDAYRSKHRDKSIAYQREWRAKNREYHNQLSLTWARSNKARTRENHLRRTYGITVADYNAMLVSQDNKCAICHCDKSTQKKIFAVDHCHKTGKVRALLCDFCNHAVGNVRDNFDIALNVAKYIQLHGEVI